VLESVREILAIRLDARGDFLMTTPALRALRRRWPDAKLHVLVQPGVAAFAQRVPWVDHVETLPCNFLMRLTLWGAGISRWLSGLRKLGRQEYDLVVDFSSLFHSAVAAWATQAPVRVGFRRNLPMGYFRTNGFRYFYTHEIPPGEELHIADEMNLLAAFVGAIPDEGGWEVGLERRDREEAHRILAQAEIDPEKGPFVILHPGSKWPPRRWSPICFAETLDILLEQGWSALVMGGPGDHEMVEAIRDACRTSPAILWDLKPLGTVCALMEKADVVVGNDSGPMHMAAAVGTPVVAIFGPTLPTRSGPRGSSVTTFYSDLECSPCQQYFTRDRCHRGHNYCLDDYRPSAVAAAVELAVDSRKRRQLRSRMSSQSH
jgi:lipopolysaccharide heptosyltransferase II